MFYSLPVLMYHSVSSMDWHCAVPAQVFEEHCAVLAKAGWRGINLAEAEDFFLKGRRPPRKTCLFTFDDGYLDNYVHAAPILKQYGHQGAIFPVLDFLEPGGRIRPDSDDLARVPERANELPELADINSSVRGGQEIYSYHFCSRAEIRRLGERNALSAAPHSLRHHGLPRGPDFTEIFRPGPARNIYHSSPYAGLWGMPAFREEPALAAPAFVPAPELLELVKTTVPQTWDGARKFFAVPQNLKDLLAAIRTLPGLGRREEEKEYRARVFAELASCRERFKSELGIETRSFCWPWGRYSRAGLEEGVRAGFRLFFTAAPGPNTPASALAARRFKVSAFSGQTLLALVRLFSSTPSASLAGLPLCKRIFQSWS